MYGKNYVTAATDTGSSCIIVHSKHYVYDGRGDNIDHYHQLQHSHKGLKIVSLNVNGIRGHPEKLKHLLANTGFDNDVPNQIIDIEGYKIEHKDRTSKEGGIAIYLRDYLNYTDRMDIVDYELEIVCVEIKPLKCRPFIIVACYRLQSDPVISFDLLEKVLSSFDWGDKEITLIGGTNCDFLDRAIDSDYNSMNLSNVYDLFSFKQLIQEPTRENLESRTIIDHIANNSERNIGHHGVIKVSMSDHYLVY